MKFKVIPNNKEDQEAADMFTKILQAKIPEIKCPYRCLDCEIMDLRRSIADKDLPK